VTLKRHLFASAAITLSGLGIAHAGPVSQMRVLTVPEPAVMRYVTQVQLSVEDAEAALAAALARKAEAEASGGDVAAAQADVDQAQAALAAAQSAAQAATEPAPVPEPIAPEPETAAPEPEPALPAPEPESVPVEQPAATEPAPASEPAPLAAPETAVEPEPAPEPEPQSAPEPAPEVAPAPETPVDAAPQPEETTPTASPEPEIPMDPAPAEEPAPAAEPETDDAPQAAPPVEPAPAEDNLEAEPAPAPETGPVPAEAPAGAEAPPAASEEVLTLPVEGGAPVLDSAKEEPASDDADASPPAAVAAPGEPAAAPPASDAEAQAPALTSGPAPQALAEQGERISRPPAIEEQTNVTIINQIDNRTIIEVGDRTYVEHDERDRLRAGSEDVYYDRLGGGRVRETIVRPNGVQLVTVSNRWGDVIQRSRIMPDGREYVLFYNDDSFERPRDAFVDPGRRLPPLRLSIPIGEYILDATMARPSAFLEFLMEPPVEQVERLYSVEEVRRSARIRDKVRRIDLDTLTFEFGKASIAEDQIQRLSDVADAMTTILEANPAETFLIEGHTDAVGRDDANLLLSDRRAETIAVALSDVFGIPPENLVTQGYGERYLKIRTEAPERLNRRVTIRRITALVTPVASR
jgi:outer membrane protein OmpA-like peptidoglycan-associated protein